MDQNLTPSKQNTPQADLNTPFRENIPESLSPAEKKSGFLSTAMKTGVLLLGGLVGSAGATEIAAAPVNESLQPPPTAAMVSATVEKLKDAMKKEKLDPETVREVERLILRSLDPELSKYSRQWAEVELSQIDPGAKKILPIAWKQIDNLPDDAPKWQFEALSLFTLTRQLGMEFPNRIGLEHIREICENRINQMPDGRPLAISVCAKGDHNGAFYIGDVMYDEMIKNGYRVQYFEAGNDTELIETLLTGTMVGTCREQRASIIIIGGHGNRTTLVLERDYGELPDNHGYMDPSDEQRFKDIGLARVLKKGGNVVLDSCSNGEGRAARENVANFMRRVFPQAKEKGIWSATQSYGPINLTFDKNGILEKVYYPVPEYRSNRENEPQQPPHNPEGDIRS